MASVYKRGKIYWGRFQYKHNIIRRSLGTVSKREAQTRLQKLIEEIRKQQWGESPPPEYDKIMLSFLNNHSAHLRPESHRRYTTSAKNLHSLLTGLNLDQITSKTLATYENTRRSEGVSSSTIRRDLACLSSMFSHANWDMQVWDSNPVSLFLKRQERRGRLKESPPRTRYLSSEEEQKLLKSAKGDLPELIAFAIDTGLRLEEQLSLTWQSVDIAKKQITVIGKRRKERTVPLLQRAIEILGSLPRHPRLDGTPDWVFCNTKGRRYGKRTRGLAAAVRRAKIPHAQWHDLRRTCGYRLLQDKGFAMHEVTLWLGHADIRVTQKVYAFLEFKHLHIALERENAKSHDRT